MGFVRKETRASILGQGTEGQQWQWVATLAVGVVITESPEGRTLRRKVVLSHPSVSLNKKILLQILSLGLYFIFY